MLRLVMLMKRKPGLSTDEFRDYYESHHRLLGEKYLRGFASCYMRRYLDPRPSRAGCEQEPVYDVLTEIWFPDRARHDACMAHLARPEIAREIAEDEARLFDRSAGRAYLTSDRESELPPPD